MTNDVKKAWNAILLIGGLAWFLFYAWDLNYHFQSRYIRLYNDGLIDGFQLADAWVNQAWNCITSIAMIVAGASFYIKEIHKHFKKGS